MHPEKKITKEDTWKPDDLRRHIVGGEHEDDGRRRDDTERKHRSGGSVERRHRHPEKEARREKDKDRERDSTREREKDKYSERDSTREREKDKYRERDSTRERAKANDAERDRHQDRSQSKKEDGSRHRTGEREERDKERRKERDRVVDDREYMDVRRESRDRRYDREEKENREREKARDRDRGNDEDRDKDKGRDAKDRDSRRDGKDRERRAERDRRRDEEREKGGRDEERQRNHEKRDRHKERDNLKESERLKDGSQDRQKDKERRERHMDREHSGQKEEREYREHRRKEKEEREGRHRERAQHDTVESRRHDGGSREVDRERAHMERKGLEGRVHGDRERVERDKHRERNHREPGDPERDLRTSTKRPSSDHSHREKTEHAKSMYKEVVMQSESVWRSRQGVLDDTEEPVEPEAEAQAEDQGFDDAQECYEEDFEDYEEDFEDVDESDGEGEDEKQHSHEDREELTPQRRKDIEAIQRAMDEENERVGTAQTRLSTEDERPKRTRGSEMPQSKGLQHGRFIDFVAAKQREVSKMVASKQKKRSTELLRLIDVDFSTTFSLLDLPPVNEYDMYIKSFGTTNTKQAYVQCNEDNTDRDIQTEDLEVSEMWTQHPAERNIACGGPNPSHEASDESISNMNIDSQRLAKFLRSASQVVAVLLEEDSAENQSLKKLRSQADTLSFSDYSLQLNTKLPFLHDRQISLVHFSQVQRQTMLSVHGPSTKPSAVRLDSKTIICIWNIWEPSRPQKILVYESEVRCCCFSPGKATLVFAGTDIGSVVLWDLREHSSGHYTLRIGNEWTLRHPTFSTDAILAASGHMCSVSSVEAVPSTVAEGLRPELPLVVSEEESSGLSFQLASLDENGVLNLWVVVELPKPNDAGSQTDLGLRPGGKVKLLHSSTLLISERSSPPDTMKPGQIQTRLLTFLPSNSNHFFVGTNMGLVNHGTSHGLKSPPKFYRPQVVGLRPVDVTSLNFSPFGEPVFLVGCGDGSVRLHTVMREQPVMEWTASTAGEAVVSVQWAQTRPTVFCVLDAASNLHIWDLLERDFEPVLTVKIDADNVTAMAVFGDPAKQNTFSGVALARQSGKIEMQYFTKRFTVPDSQDLGKLQSMMDEAP